MRTTEELVELARQGNRSAVTELVQRHEHVVLSTAWTIVGDFHHAQDVAQEALVDAVRGLKRLREPSAFVPWLLQIARRTAYRHRRQRPATVPALEPDQVVAQPSWTTEFEEVLPMLERLPEHEQMVMQLKYVGGLSVKQIAAELRRPVGTVTKQLSRGLARLQQMLVEIES